jgi:predicted MPP superfamily phosphohydrolase
VVVEVYRPAEPELQYASVPINAQGELHQVQLYWDKTCYKGKYHVYKMNSKGNWFKIHELVSNDEIIYLPLANTELQTGLIETEDANGNAIYHHFKVVAENTSGLLSSGENILTIHNPDNWTDLDDL